MDSQVEAKRESRGRKHKSFAPFLRLTLLSLDDHTCRAGVQINALARPPFQRVLAESPQESHR